MKLNVLFFLAGLMCAIFVGGEGKSYGERSVACVAGDAGCTAACYNHGGGCCGHTGNCRNVCYCHNSGYDHRCTHCDI